ncbi:hypothetical protein C8R47DRAFT_1239637 [Mycena vitilis]|nr:hypothetical protein C8R47DRAFT_1239637 [Mycena vitilis]
MLDVQSAIYVHRIIIRSVVRAPVRICPTMYYPGVDSTYKSGYAFTFHLALSFYSLCTLPSWVFKKIPSCECVRLFTLTPQILKVKYIEVIRHTEKLGGSKDQGPEPREIGTPEENQGGQLKVAFLSFCRVTVCVSPNAQDWLRVSGRGSKGFEDLLKEHPSRLSSLAVRGKSFAGSKWILLSIGGQSMANRPVLLDISEMVAYSILMVLI